MRTSSTRSLLFYAAAARHSHPEFFAGVENIVLTILQPQSIEPDADMVSSVAVTHAELDDFIARLSRRLRRGAFGSAALGSGAIGAGSAPRKTDLPGAYRPAARSRAIRGCRRRRLGTKQAYLQALADGLSPRRRGQGHSHRAARSGEARAAER